MCAGYDNGDVKLFDLRAMAVRWEGNLGTGVACHASLTAGVQRAV